MPTELIFSQDTKRVNKKMSTEMNTPPTIKAGGVALCGYGDSCPFQHCPLFLRGHGSYTGSNTGSFRSPFCCK